MSERFPAIPLACWVQRRLESLAHYSSPTNALADELGVSPRQVYCWQHQENSEGRPAFTFPAESVEEALGHAEVLVWEVLPWLRHDFEVPGDRPTHGWCSTCNQDSAVAGDQTCLWCGGPTEQRESKSKRGGWRRPDLRGSKYSEAQLRALHVFHMRDGLSINELAKRTFAVAGYKTHHSAAVAIGREWKRLGLTARKRIEQVRKSCTVHGLAAKHGSRPGYGTYKRRVIRGEADQPQCEGVRENPPRVGEPCQSRAMKGSRYCPQHDPTRAEERRAHLDRVHEETRQRIAAGALPMLPFAAYVKRRWREEGTLAAAAERLDLHPTALSCYARSLGSDKKPKPTIQRKTVERVLECDGLELADLYPELFSLPETEDALAA